MRSRALGMVLLCAGGAGAVAAAPRALPATDGKWQLSDARVETADGRQTITIETGTAVRRDVSLLDGTIDFDVQLSRRRSFVYVLFRIQAEGENEEMYLRPHKSGLPDAIQYAPVYQGHSAWQLYHGPGGTAAVEFEPGAWTHVRLVLQGRRAALFVGDMRKPALFVPRLAREPQPGYIALRAFVPRGTPGSGPAARYANVTVSPGEAAFDVGALPVPAAAPDPGVVRSWAVSRSFLPNGLPETSLPGAAISGPFRVVDAEAGGLVELHRFVPLPKDSPRLTAAVARIHVRAAGAGLRAFELGFSDVATLFLNGRPIFRGDQSYSYEGRRDGLIGFDQARLYLPLAAGDNEVSVVVSDSFGGWGIMGRFLSPAGLEIEAR